MVISVPSIEKPAQYLHIGRAMRRMAKAALREHSLRHLRANERGKRILPLEERTYRPLLLFSPPRNGSVSRQMSLGSDQVILELYGGFFAEDTWQEGFSIVPPGRETRRFRTGCFDAEYGETLTAQLNDRVATMLPYLDRYISQGRYEAYVQWVLHAMDEQIASVKKRPMLVH